MKTFQDSVDKIFSCFHVKLTRLMDVFIGIIAKIDKFKYRFIFTSLSYFFLLCIVYCYFILKRYGGYNNYYFDFSLLNSIIVLICIFAIVTTLPKRELKISALFLHIQFLIMVMPMFVISAIGKGNIIVAIGITMVMLLQAGLTNKVLGNKKMKPQAKTKMLFNGNKIVVLFVCASVLILILSIITVRMPSFRALDFNEVYVIRSTNNLTPISIYLSNWAALALNPFLMVWFLDKKDYKKASVMFIIQVLMYMIYVYKSYLLLIVVVIFFYWWSKKKHLLISLHLVLLLGVLISFLIYILGVKALIMLPAIFINRLLFIPANIKYCYFDFFSNHDFLYMSEGMIGKVFNMPQQYGEKGISYYITDVYYPNSPGSNSNTGYLSDAFANIGWFGVILFALVIICIFLFVDMYNNKINANVIIGIFIYPCFLYNDTGLLTSLLTGGVAILILVVCLMNIRRRKKRVEVDDNVES